MKKDLTGQTFGDLFVVGVSEVSRNGHYRYQVRCSCGAEKTVFGTHMIQGSTLHCGCKRTRSYNWQGYKGVSKTYFSSVKRGAAGEKGRAKMSFTLTLEVIGDLFEEQERLCALTGLPISCKDRTASLDRIDSSRGYEEDNIQWLHKDVNMMKRHYTENYFKFLCKKVTESNT